MKIILLTKWLINIGYMTYSKESKKVVILFTGIWRREIVCSILNWRLKFVILDWAESTPMIDFESIVK